jgi:hypothetical protein
VNDGQDNQCLGDPRFGITDELEGSVGWSVWPVDPGGPYFEFCSPYQPGALSYQIAVSDRKDFRGACTLQTVHGTCGSQRDRPTAGSALYFLVRSLSPFTGSWGRDSSETERQGPCGL